MKNIFRIFPSLILCALVTPLGATPAAYLDMDPAARPSGMGSAFVALSDDVNAPLFNPAGLASMGLNQFMIGGSIGFLNDEQFHNFLSAAQQLPPDSYLGFYAIQYGISDLNHDIYTTGLNFQDTEWALGATYAYELDYHVQLGISSSFLIQNLINLHAQGFGGADIGIMVMPTVLYDINLGVCVRHLGGFSAWDSGTTEYLNPDVRIGASWKLFDKQLIMDYDAEWQTQFSLNIINHVGVEWRSLKYLVLRGGWDQNTPTLGLTFNWTNYSLDYSFRLQDYANQGSLHRVAVDYAL
jgi:hypothetical protein